MQGLRVVDLSTDIGGAYCARLLASCGADVTLVEPPEGDGLRHQPPLPHVPGRTERVSTRHEHLNANKRGIVVDRTTAAGRRVLDELLAGAQVVLSSCNGDPERSPASEEQVRRRWPGVAHVVTSPFGLTGPYA